MENEALLAGEKYDSLMLNFTEALFSEFNTTEIGVFYDEIANSIDSVNNLLARTYLKEVNCAVLSNSSRYKEAEQCCESIVEIGLRNNRTDIVAYGLHDLSYVYNHQGRYNEQIALLSRIIIIWKERDRSIDYLRFAIQQKGVAFSVLGMFDSSFHYMEQALDLEKEYGDSLSLCFLYEKYSRIYLEKGDYLNSYEYGQKGLEIARAINSKSRKGTNLMYVGFSAFYLGRYNQAIEHELEALALYEGERNSNTSSVYIRLGRIYNSIADYDQALRYLNEAESILKEVDYDIGLAKAKTERAYTEINIGQYEEAFNSIEFARKVFEEIDDKIYLSLAKRRMAQLYDAQNLCDLGIDVQNQAIKILENADKKGSLATAYLEKANILNNCNRRLDARNTALRGLELQKETGDLKSISDAHFFLYNFYKEEGNESSALFHFEEHQKIYKLLTQSAEQQAIAEERSRFKVEQIEKNNEVVISQNLVLQERNRLYAVLGGGLLLAGAIGMFYFQKLRKLNKEIAGQNFKIEGQNKELRKLNNTKDKFFGIIAHDLRNPLVAFQGLGQQIRHYTKSKQLEKLTILSKQVEALSTNVGTLLDNLLNWSLLQTGQIPYVPRMLNVLDEVDEVYELIDPLAKTKEIELLVDVDESISVYADVRAVQTIFRNIITNSLKYTERKGRISISSRIEMSYTIISIKDNGIGMSTKQLEDLRVINKTSQEGTDGEKGTGLGLILCFDLVKMNQGEITIESELGEGTEVIIKLPYS